MSNQKQQIKKMPKKEKVIFIGEQQYPMDSVVLKISYSTLLQLLEEEGQHVKKTCISTVRPFISGDVGRTRLAELEEEDLVLVEEEICQEPHVEYLIVDESLPERSIKIEDFSRFRQTIRRSV